LRTERGAARLAIGPGNADDTTARAWIVIETPGEGTGVFRQGVDCENGGAIYPPKPAPFSACFNEHGGGTCANDLRHEFTGIDIAPEQGDKDVPACDESTIELYTGDAGTLQ
jgi:hypothetical protein